MVFGPPIAPEKLQRWLQPGETARITARPTVAGFLTMPALILSILSVVIFGGGTLATTISINGLVNVNGATADSVLAGFRLAEISFFLAWVIGIVGTCLWGHVGRGARAGLAVLVAIGTPIVWFLGVVASITSVNPNNVNTPQDAATVINNALWSAFAEAGAVLIVFALLIPLLVTVMKAGRSSYFLTDRRVVKVVGSTPKELPLAAVAELSMRGGVASKPAAAGTLVFATQPTAGMGGAKVERRNMGVVWFGVPRAGEARQAAESTIQWARSNSMPTMPGPPAPPPPP